MSTQKRICDYCSEATALLYCRADSAKLCFHCDREVHSTNQLFSKHTRFQLCDGCDASPASIFCSTENSLLCQNCDWENHSHSLSSVHDRRPLEGFTGYPSVAELSAIIGIEDSFQKTLSLSDGPDGGCDGDDESKRSVGLVDEFSDMLFWDTPAVVSIDDLITPIYSSLSFQALEVPHLPKNLNASCGHHKEEILAQLRGLAQLEHNFKFNHANLQGFQPVQLEQNLQQVNEFMGFGHVDEPTMFHTYEASSFQWNDESGEAANQGFLPNTTLSGYLEESYKVPEKQMDVSSSLNHANSGHEVQSQCPVPVNSETLVVPAKLTLDELNSQDRETAISRYKEKKRTRRYDKHIRYESRKVRAESRTRIRGRFAKKDS